MKYDELPKEIKRAMFKRHTHAELVTPAGIVYKEQDVIDLFEECFYIGITPEQAIKGFLAFLSERGISRIDLSTKGDTEKLSAKMQGLITEYANRL